MGLGITLLVSGRKLHSTCNSDAPGFYTVFSCEEDASKLFYYIAHIHKMFPQDNIYIPPHRP